MNFFTIQTDRLQLKKLSPEDFIYIFENLHEAEIKILLGHTTEAAFQKEKNRFLKGYSTYNRSFVFFQLIYKANNKIIGSAGFHTWATDHNRAEIGYEITDENYKKQGLMTEAVAALLPYGFTHMNLHRIEANVAPNNIPSLKIMKHFNFKEEGLLKEQYLINGVYEDSVIFAKLKKA